MPPVSEVRLVREHEIGAVRELVRDAYAGDFELNPAYLAEIERVAERALTAEVWVAADASTGTLLGSVTTPRAGARLSPVARHDDELDFRFLGVAADARGRGVGETLVRHVLALAASRGIRRVVLNTGPEMRSAQRLYERLGFARLPEREYRFERADGTSFLMMAYGREVVRRAPDASASASVA
ncbi:GNAT family N-acetyltransferase [Agromyces flavus]|nr:GNAT family N-acetyltransferase [Agromyces flavus]GGI48711.1 N-acetyltransferase [Agromyces flavus]SDR88701.1 Acetyltransferase (GNAT) family protein [Agromyces flavus]